MSIKRFTGALLGVLLAVAGISALARADEMSELTKITFQQSVQIPGRVLPPGSYYFTRLDNGNEPDVNVVRIFNSDKKPLDIILHTVTVERERVRGSTILTFAERPNGRPPALVDWFYPGSLEGHQFLYSPRRERRIEHSEMIKVASNDDGDITLQITGKVTKRQ